ncbi:hypothetical protein R6Z07F_000013 [Ovis aries]
MIKAAHCPRCGADVHTSPVPAGNHTEHLASGLAPLPRHAAGPCFCASGVARSAAGVQSACPALIRELDSKFAITSKVVRNFAEHRHLSQARRSLEAAGPLSSGPKDGSPAPASLRTLWALSLPSLLAPGLLRVGLAGSSRQPQTCQRSTHPAAPGAARTRAACQALPAGCSLPDAQLDLPRRASAEQSRASPPATGRSGALRGARGRADHCPRGLPHGPPAVHFVETVQTLEGGRRVRGQSAGSGSQARGARDESQRRLRGRRQAGREQAGPPHPSAGAAAAALARQRAAERDAVPEKLRPSCGPGPAPVTPGAPAGTASPEAPRTGARGALRPSRPRACERGTCAVRDRQPAASPTELAHT